MNIMHVDVAGAQFFAEAGRDKPQAEDQQEGEEHMCRTPITLTF